MIDATAKRIGRDARYRRPVETINGSAHHNIIGRTPTLKPTIFPYNIDFARTIDFGRGPERIPPGSLRTEIDVTVTVLLQLAPPSVDLKARTDVSVALSI